VFAEAHIGVLPIDDLVTRVYFHFVDARRYVENLWMIADHGWLSRLQAIYEYERLRRGAGHDDLRRIRQLLSPRTEPTAGR